MTTNTMTLSSREVDTKDIEVPNDMLLKYALKTVQCLTKDTALRNACAKYLMSHKSDLSSMTFYEIGELVTFFKTQDMTQEILKGLK